MEELDKKAGLCLLDMRFSSLTQTTDGIIYSLNSRGVISAEEIEKYQKLRRLEHLFVESLRAGICDDEGDLDWKELHHRGWLCEYDYTTMFKDELQGLNPEKWQER